MSDVQTQAGQAAVLPGMRWLRGVMRLRADPLKLFTEVVQMGAPVVTFPLGPRRAFALTRPELIKHVLQDNQRNYSKSTPGFDALRLILGQGLLTSEGDFWLRQRRIAQPAFHRQRIAGMAGTMLSCTQDMLERWSALPEGSVLDVHAEMMKLTLRIVGITLMDTDVAHEADRVGPAVSALLVEAEARITAPVHPPLWVPTPSNRRIVHHMGTLDRIVGGIIQQRRAHGGDAGDLLSMLMLTTDEETGERMSDAQLRDEVMTMFLAGHETTANALTWTFLLLSQAPQVAARLWQELDQVLGDRAPTVEDLPRLVWLDQVLKESLRLYPPAWLFARSAIKDDQIGGCHIPAGAVVFVCPWAMHHHPGLWENPEGFDPERFQEDKEKALHRFAWFPFGGGPRMCIGAPFATMESKLLLAAILRHHRLDLVSGQDVRPWPKITLRVREGLKMRLHRRPQPLPA